MILPFYGMLFTDQTGTLTEGIMSIFIHFIVPQPSRSFK